MILKSLFSVLNNALAIAPSPNVSSEVGIIVTFGADLYPVPEFTTDIFGI